MPNYNAFDEYVSANRAGQKYRSKNSGDEYCGYLPSLEAKLKNMGTLQHVALGINELPLNKIVGTYASSRCNSFSGNFMPILSKYSELANKWQYLYAHHISEGIYDPIKVVEHMDSFYVVEGAKRVSVMKYLGAYSIPGEVQRLIPPKSA